MSLDHLGLSENDSPFRSRARDIASVDMIKDRKSGKSKGFTSVTMSGQSEADKSVRMFNAYSLDDHFWRVLLLRHRKQRRFGKIELVESHGKDFLPLDYPTGSDLSKILKTFPRIQE